MSAHHASTNGDRPRHGSARPRRLHGATRWRQPVLGAIMAARPTQRPIVAATSVRHPSCGWATRHPRGRGSTRASSRRMCDFLPRRSSASARPALQLQPRPPPRSRRPARPASTPGRDDVHGCASSAPKRRSRGLHALRLNGAPACASGHRWCRDFHLLRAPGPRVFARGVRHDDAAVPARLTALTRPNQGDARRPDGFIPHHGGLAAGAGCLPARQHTQQPRLDGANPTRGHLLRTTRDRYAPPRARPLRSDRGLPPQCGGPQQGARRQGGPTWPHTRGRQGRAPCIGGSGSWGAAPLAAVCPWVTPRAFAAAAGWGLGFPTLASGPIPPIWAKITA